MIDAAAFEDCIAAGGVAVFPADTVYGLACDPEDEPAVARMYALKGRPPGRPSAVMWFALEPALAALDPGPRTRALLARLMPGPLTALLPNPRGRYPRAGGGDVLGVRVPELPALASLRRVVLQTSANLAGGPDPRRLEEVPPAIRRGADLVLDGGELPGTPSSVIDLRGFEEGGEWAIVRAGALPADAIARAAGTLELR